MSKPIRCILLVDDDPDDNFLHRVVLEEADVCEEIRITEKASEALHYLTNTDHADYLRPDLILLDINMPGINGFEFITHYRQLPPHKQAKAALIMLTTSINPIDQAKANALGMADNYYQKPLTSKLLLKLMNTYFA